MYTKAHESYVLYGYCTHLINGGINECEEFATKAWVYLDIDTGHKLKIKMVVPVCKQHVSSMRFAINSSKGILKGDSWELVSRDSDSWTLIEASLEE